MNNPPTDSLAEQAQQLFHEGKLSEAKQKLSEHLLVEPASAIALTNLGYIEYLLGDGQSALGHCEEAVAIDPQLPEAQGNLGAVLMYLGDFAGAKTAFDRGLAIAPNNAMLLSGLGLLHFKQHAFSHAAQLHRRAIHASPGYAEAYCNLALCQLEGMQAAAAIENLNIAVQLKPQLSLARSNLLLAQQYMPEMTPRQMKAALKSQATPNSKGNRIRWPASTDEKRRIGFVSADLSRHPVGYFLQALFEIPRAEGYEFICYSNRDTSDAVTERLKATSDQWFQIEQLTDLSAAELIANHQIDVLIDLSGHTEGNRLGIFERKAAPIQASWLGYFASTGVENMDYVLLSEDQAPEGVEAYYSEKIHRLKGCQFNYLPAPDSLLESEVAPQQQNAEAIRFGCFNNLAKINSSVVSTWAGILKALPEATVKLKWRSLNDQAICQHVAQQFGQFGISANRLELSPATPHAEMMLEYLDIDVALDPFPFSGALSTCEALWMGTPVVSLRQVRPVSRQSWSILKSLGLDDLCVETPEQYVSTAVKLANDIKRRQSLREHLRDLMLKTTPQQTVNLSEELAQFFFESRRNIE